jgi:hypothetical protein
MTMVAWGKGRNLLWDVTCSDTFAPSHLPTTTLHAGAAAVDAEKAKHRKYTPLEETYFFTPVAVETSGVWGPEGLSFIREIGTRIMLVNGDPRSTSYLIQRISLAIMRGNATSMLGTLPYGQTLDEMFYL